LFTFQVLCGERSDFVESYWQCPQGGIKANEDPVDAAMRELNEELGIPACRLRLLPSIFQPSESFWYTFMNPVEKDGTLFDGQEQRAVLFMLDGDIGECNLCVPGYPQEFRRIEWRSFPDIVAEVLPSKQSVYTQLLSIILSTMEHEALFVI
jgi:putative (di)nucleoside polyphosphate hydrolase